ncbi:DUF6615 family protein [Enterobacter roggenkampii]|uniref:DUF6615 family protein n=1 Tax=Enterobacter roggenkampii TaxID=1812935 RepID=UPI0020043480|nr:DUF6615 family protein [Enterobacter roggenkampii]MCK6909281.1 hypothetical protein [Enterobacter roggenkampii]
MSLCKSNKDVSLDVKNFMLNVSDVKEESITDYLVWKWRELDARFKYINITTFTRHMESTTTGADFELELWLVGRKFHFPLIFQAKKFTKKYDSYVKKLNYPKGTQAQLKKLLSYSKKHKKIPFYAFYSIPDKDTKLMCPRNETSSTSIFMADAYTVKDYADGKHSKHGKNLSLNEILKRTNPFHCIFCCPHSRSGDYFTHYFSKLAESNEPHKNEDLPDYVKLLLNDQINKTGEKEILKLIDRNELKVFRSIGVYDISDIENDTDNKPRHLHRHD